MVVPFRQIFGTIGHSCVFLHAVFRMDSVQVEHQMKQNPDILL